MDTRRFNAASNSGRVSALRWGLTVSLFAVSCVSPRPASDMSQIDQGLRERTGQGIDAIAETRATADLNEARTTKLPQSVDLSDGLSREEAKSLGLFNNAAFHADLARIGIAQAQLEQAAVLQNPMLSLLLPLGPKQLEGSVTQALQDLWLRPGRVEIAQQTLVGVGHSLVFSGLGLLRQIDDAYTRWQLTTDQRRIAAERLEAHKELALLASVRLDVGDISGLEADIVERAATAGKVAAEVSDQAMHQARAFLFHLVGLDEGEHEALALGAPDDSLFETQLSTQREQAMAVALIARPDLRAAEIEVQIAAERVGFPRKEAWSLSLVLDANAKGSQGFEAGPGVVVALPIFDRGGAKQRLARAELEARARSYLALKSEVEFEVARALDNVTNARDVVAAWRSEVLPMAANAEKTSEERYQRGETSYIPVLEAKLELLNTVEAERIAWSVYRQSLAALQASLGQRIGSLNQGSGMPVAEVGPEGGDGVD